MKYPKKFDGTALVLGTIMVDFEYLFLKIFEYFPVSIQMPLGHSLIGIFMWVIPISIFCSFLFSRWVGPAMGIVVEKIEKGKGILSYFGMNDLQYLKFKKYSLQWVWISFYSALIGALTHLLLDLPSHQYIPWFHPFLVIETFDFMKFEIANYGNLTIGPFSWALNLTIYNLIWLLESIIFAIICLYYLRKIKSEEFIKKWYTMEKKEVDT